MATYAFRDDLNAIQEAIGERPEDHIFDSNRIRFSDEEIAEWATVHGDEITSMEVTVGKKEEEVTKLCEDEKRLQISNEEYHRMAKEKADTLRRSSNRVSKELEELLEEEEKLSHRKEELLEEEEKLSHRKEELRKEDAELFDEMRLEEEKLVKWKFDIDEQMRVLQQTKLHKQDSIFRMKGTICKNQTMKIQLEKQAAERKAAEEEVEREDARKRAERKEAERLRRVAEAKAERLKKVGAEMEAKRKKAQEEEKKRIEDIKEKQEKAIAEARESVVKVATLDNSDDHMEIEREEVIEEGVAPNMDVSVLEVCMKIYRQLSPEAKLKVIMS
jgi:hypothetical protein